MNDSDISYVAEGCAPNGMFSIANWLVWEQEGDAVRSVTWDFQALE